MPFDAMFLTCVRQEMSQALCDGRIEKITQPARDTLVLQLRTRGGHKKLLLNANPAQARVQLTEITYENPATPPMFCMLLRKHLSGGKLQRISQPPMERAVTFHFACTDELGVACERKLVAEVMGGASNILLLDGDDRILDCIRRTDMESARPALPGLFYRPPVQQEKRDPTGLTAEQIAQMLDSAAVCAQMDKWLLQSFCGISPLWARELSLLCCGSVDAVLPLPDCGRTAQKLAALPPFAMAQQLAQLEPTLLLQGEKPKDFSFRNITQYDGFYTKATCPTCCELLDRFYGQRDKAEKIRQKGQALRKTVSNAYERVQRKLGYQRKEREASLDRERTRQLGDIVTANLYQIPRGASAVRVVDFYDPQMQEITVKLNPALSPQQNAAKFYKDYSKAKTAQRVLTEQIANNETELSYLGSVLDAIDRAESEKDLLEIRAELLSGGYVRDRESSKRMKTAPTKPMQFRSSDGFLILVGRNNMQNDQLTTKIAEKRDIWLHVQKIHGSHVVILTGGVQPPDETVTEAMMLAAYYSQARGGSMIPVDYCPVKQVKKPAGAKPGMVVYEHYRTGYVTPNAELPAKLQA